MTINLADNSPRISYSVAQGVTQSTFTVPFEFFAQETLNVYVDGVLKTLTTDYTVTGGDGSTGSVAISVTGASGGSTVVITRQISLERTADFPTSGPFQIAALNTELDRIIAIAADLNDGIARSLQLTDFDIAANLTLPSVDNRKGKTLAFNSVSGAVEAGPSISDTQTVANASADIALLADIQDGTTATNAITNVNGIRTDVTTVSGISANVTTVAGNSANVTTVAGISANVTTVAGDSSDIQALGPISSNITTVAGISSNVTTVAGDSADIQALAAKTTEIGLLGVADVISDMNTLATSAIITDMDALADLAAEIDALGDVSVEVATVAGISSDVTTVAGISSNVTSVAGISGNVTTVAGISANVTAVAGDEADIGTVATNISNVNTVAGISGNVTTVAGISADVTSVAGDATNIGTVATNISNVNTVAPNIASVNTNAANITDIQNASANAATATTQAGIATTKASEAAASASAASASEANADTSEANALTYSSNAATSAAAAASSAAGIAGYDLDVIAETKGVTAVDVFVYDTSRDTDGGSWRKRTQGTSWYNETLNTATRGSRREFPAVAVIVAENTNVTIYDGDDPSLPMWMVFVSNGYAGMLFESSNASKSLFALNGQVACGDSAFDLQVVNFISDLGVSYSKDSSISGTFKRPISGRNSGTLTTPADNWIFGTVPNIVNRAVNDIAMTVLPNAPIDAATGLPVPTIAVATDGGVSVIKDDGTVVDSHRTDGMGKVSFYKDKLFYSLNSSTVYNVLWADDYLTDGFGDIFDSYRSNSAPSTISALALSGLEARAYPLVSASTVDGLTVINDNAPDRSESSTAHITSSYNTGWMPGDIKGAFLSDTDDTDLVASTPLDDDFSSYADQAAAEAAGYAPQSASVTFDAANDEWDWSGDTGLDVSGAATGLAAGVYTVTWTQANRTTGQLFLQYPVGTNIQNNSADGTYSATINYTGSGVIRFVGGSSYNGSLQNISVKLADADRSVNNNGLIVNGTVTRSPVASGADLVAYSGFSGSNYLEQPYNSDLDFGTGDFCVMGWNECKSNSTEAIFVRQSTSGSFFGEGAHIYLATHLGKIFARTSGGFILNQGPVLTGSGWHLLTMVRRSGVLYAYIDGELIGSTSDTSNLDNSGAVSRVGRLNYNGDPADLHDGSLALIRISATAPTSEQIAKIYEDEKVLFQENAQATLYGSSDAVTALAHDDVTDLLHVGTSAGRSVFQGLRRVENTTTAVGTAISASNGMVVEE